MKNCRFALQVVKSDELGQEKNNISNVSIIHVFATESGSGVQSNASCLTKYTGTFCQQYLQQCLPGAQNTSEIFISNLIDDQSVLEDDIGKLLYYLDLLIQPSDECRRRVVPFLCLYTFGLCDENSTDYRPKTTDCSDIRDNVCKSEWQKANKALESFGIPSLPDCSIFSDDGLVCSHDSCELNTPLLFVTTVSRYFLVGIHTFLVSLRYFCNIKYSIITT